jgi:hypothetical protein
VQSDEGARNRCVPAPIDSDLRADQLGRQLLYCFLRIDRQIPLMLVLGRKGGRGDERRRTVDVERGQHVGHVRLFHVEGDLLRFPLRQGENAAKIGKPVAIDREPVVAGHSA